MTMPTKLTSPKDLAPGDYYEDCFYHPCLCTDVDVSDGGRDAEISGVSLVDGTFPHSCCFRGCSPRRLTFEEAMRWKFFGPADVDLPTDKQWWDSSYEFPPSFLRRPPEGRV
jgi:hypothetical protein